MLSNEFDIKRVKELQEGEVYRLRTNAYKRYWSGERIRGDDDENDNEEELYEGDYHKAATEWLEWFFEAG